MIDVNLLVRNWLLDNTALVTLLGGSRVYVGAIPEGFKPEAGPGVVVSVRGGDSHHEIPIVSPSVQITCWAGVNQRKKAREVYLAIWSQLQGRNGVSRGTDGFVIASLEEVQGQDITDPDSGWSTVVTFFRMVIRSPFSDVVSSEPVLSQNLNDYFVRLFPIGDQIIAGPYGLILDDAGARLSIGGALGGQIVADRANTLAIRNGVTPQELRIYEKFVSLLNAEWLQIQFDNGVEFGSPVFRIDVTGAGASGVGRGLVLTSNQGASFGLGKIDGAIWNIHAVDDFSVANDFSPGRDNFSDIGRDGHRPRNLLLGTKLSIGDGAVEDTVTPVGSAAAFAKKFALGIKSVETRTLSVSVGDPTIDNHVVAGLAVGTEFAPSSTAAETIYAGIANVPSIPASNTQEIHGFYGQFADIEDYASARIINMYGGSFGAHSRGASQIDNLRGVTANADNGGSGSVADLSAVKCVRGGGSGVTDRSHGVYVEAHQFNSGTTNHNYGLYIEDQTNSPSVNPDPWALYSLGGKIRFDKTSPPASASAPGLPGQIAWDANFFYVCVATNTWKRTALASW